MKAVIVKGNPQYLGSDLASRYYRDIENHLSSLGFEVEYDAGEDFTRPRQDADLYVGHSRGAGRYEFMKEESKPKFLKLGTVDGVIHPVDRKWQEEVWYPGIPEHPPKEHFMYSKEQRSAVEKLVRKLYPEKQR